MIELLQSFQNIIELGLIFGVVVCSVYLSSVLIKFDNLAVEGAFGVGGALSAMIIASGFNPWFGLFVSAVVGAISGFLTGLLKTKLQLNNLISGIVITTGFFSITLKIAGSNMGLGDKQTIFNMMPACVAPLQGLILLVSIAGMIVWVISWLLKTEIGFLLRAVGDSPQMLINVGKSADAYIILGLMISNALAGLAGGLFVNYLGYFSIWSTVGILIVGLAGMMLAQAFSSRFGLVLFLGAIAYQAIIALTFELQVDQDWNKLITACLIVMLIVGKNMLYENKERL